jgi:prolyl oligopeptidase PreP (S9A serine peptidase family)
VQRQQDLFNAELQHLEDVKKQKEQDEKDAVARQNQQNADLLKAQDEYRKQQQTALQAYQQQQQQAQQAYAQEQARIFEEQRKAAEAEAKRQEERLRKLNTLGQQSISVADVRSVEGANLVLQTAAQAQDPALIQARLQTKLLEKMAIGIAQAASNYFNQPVAIVGAARLN